MNSTHIAHIKQHTITWAITISSSFLNVCSTHEYMHVWLTFDCHQIGVPPPPSFVHDSARVCLHHRLLLSHHLHYLFHSSRWSHYGTCAPSRKSERDLFHSCQVHLLNLFREADAWFLSTSTNSLTAPRIASLPPTIAMKNTGRNAHRCDKLAGSSHHMLSEHFRSRRHRNLWIPLNFPSCNRTSCSVV